MDYKAVSQQVVDNVGGLENIEGATHCVTRLRLVLKDTSKDVYKRQFPSPGTGR